MTKQWEDYRSVIEDLYKKYTLATVRQKMIDRYGFKASQRLEKWGIHKYKPRNRGAHPHPPLVPDQQFPDSAEMTSPRRLQLTPGGVRDDSDRGLDARYAVQALELSSCSGLPEPTTASTSTPTSSIATPTSIATTRLVGNVYKVMGSQAPHASQQSALVDRGSHHIIDQQCGFLSHADAHNTYHHRPSPVVVVANDNHFSYPSHYHWIDYPSV
ncbi:hypothetical protein F5Y17DRAFT_460533 [Xylariaceae sp. FL0594]|nr:hypothetical protein F5Y17DRAFT_460533 [Xylariaceae sp. FL0594]